MDGGTLINIPSNNCVKCKGEFEDVKSVVQCMLCKNYYHGKCENVDLRGFHMRKSTWKCEQCLGSQGENKTEGKPERSRKRSRVDDYIDLNLIEGMNETLGMLLKNTYELNKKVDTLIEENRCLKLEIIELKKVKSQDCAGPNIVNTSYASVAANTVDNNKVLVIRQKGQQKDVQQIKKDLQEKINPGEIGIGVSMGRKTKDGGLILSCGNEKDISLVQSEIQNRLGENYEVDRPKIREHRIKVVGIHESEYNAPDECIIDRVTKQNYLNTSNNNLKVKLLRRTNVINRKFNIIFEVDSITYNLLINKQKMNIGWNKCLVFNDYGIIRCYNCNKYGHLQKECKDKRTCSKCGGDHDGKDCSGNPLDCVNCKMSNTKFGMNLDTNHTVWDVVKCETYKRIEKIQKNKFLQ